MRTEQYRSIFSIFVCAYSGTYSYPKWETAGSPCHHQVLIGIHRMRTEFRSRIFLRLGAVTLTAKDRASTIPPILKMKLHDYLSFHAFYTLMRRIPLHATHYLSKYSATSRAIRDGSKPLESSILTTDTIIKKNLWKKKTCKFSC